eukprot:6176913-Pleurochrysis_carterae.AAC.6
MPHEQAFFMCSTPIPECSLSLTFRIMYMLDPMWGTIHFREWSTSLGNGRNRPKSSILENG